MVQTSESAESADLYLIPYTFIFHLRILAMLAIVTTVTPKTSPLKKAHPE